MVNYEHAGFRFHYMLPPRKNSYTIIGKNSMSSFKIPDSDTWNFDLIDRHDRAQNL